MGGEQTDFFGKDKWIFRKTNGRWCFYTGVCSLSMFFRTVKLPPPEGFSVGLSSVSLLEVDLSQRGNSWKPHFLEVAAIHQIREAEKASFCHLLNVKCFQLKIIFTLTLGLWVGPDSVFKTRFESRWEPGRDVSKQKWWGPQQLVEAHNSWMESCRMWT